MRQGGLVLWAETGVEVEPAVMVPEVVVAAATAKVALVALKVRP